MLYMSLCSMHESAVLGKETEPVDHLVACGSLHPRHTARLRVYRITHNGSTV